MIVEKEPFLHIIIDNFLDEDEYEKIVKIYNKLNFYKKYCDLYRFYQTNELNQISELDFFTDKIKKILNNINDLSLSKNEKLISNHHSSKNVENTWFNIFASFYKKNNYLLCHDDLIDDRKYAFSYYLEDFISGELVLYDETASKEIKKLDVIKNRIVIFEVSDISFHEVAYCQISGRKAFTGWYNIKNLPKVACKKFVKKKYESKYEFVDIPEKITSDLMLMKIGEFNFEHNERALVGPFTERKVYILSIENIIVPVIAKMKLIESNIYFFSRYNYILLEERPRGNFYDVFIMATRDERVLQKKIITYIESDGRKAFDLLFENNSLYCIKRNDLNFFFPVTKYSYFLVHFVFKEECVNLEK